MQTRKFFEKVKAFTRDTSGTAAFEYAMIGFLISISVIAGASAIGTSDAVTLTSVKEAWPE